MKILYILWILSLSAYAEEVPHEQLDSLIRKNDLSKWKGKELSKLLGILKLSQKDRYDHSYAMRYAVSRYKISDSVELFVEIGMEGNEQDRATIISATFIKHVKTKLAYKLLDSKEWVIFFKITPEKGKDKNPPPKK